MAKLLSLLDVPLAALQARKFLLLAQLGEARSFQSSQSAILIYGDDLLSCFLRIGLSSPGCVGRDGNKRSVWATGRILMDNHG